LRLFVVCFFPATGSRDRSAAPTTVGGEFPALALSIREVGASFHPGPRFRRPPCDPGRWAFPRPVLALASLSRLPIPGEAQVLTHIHPGTIWCASTGAPLFPGPTMSGDSWSCQGPRAPLPVHGVTWHALMSRPMAAGIPPPSSLLRAHAPVLPPPRASVVPSTPGLCRLRSAPAGSRTFPTLSLRLCPCVLGPLPRRLVWGPYPLLPPRQRPAPRADRVGAPPCPYSDVSTAPFSRLQSFADVQARRGARHPDRSYRYGLHRRAAVTFPSEPLTICYLPVPRIC
jgi:hypothetical protein